MTKRSSARRSRDRDKGVVHYAPLLKVTPELHDSPLGNLLLEDAAAAREHGRVTARVAVGPDGNPFVYSTDEVVRKAIVKSIQERTNVHVYDIPPVTEHDFRKLLREGFGAKALAAPVVEESQLSEGAVQTATINEVRPFSLVIRDGRETVHEEGFEKVTDAVHARDEHGESGQTATIKGRDGKVAQYRGDRAIWTFGRTRWSR